MGVGVCPHACAKCVPVCVGDGHSAVRVPPCVHVGVCRVPVCGGVLWACVPLWAASMCVSMSVCPCTCFFACLPTYKRVSMCRGVPVSLWVCVPMCVCGAVPHVFPVPACARALRVDVCWDVCAAGAPVRTARLCALWLLRCHCEDPQHWRGLSERLCCLRQRRVSSHSREQTGLSPQLTLPAAGGWTRDPLRSPPVSMMLLWSQCASGVPACSVR